MQDYYTNQYVPAHAGVFGGSLPLQEEGLLPKVLFQRAVNLGNSAKAIVSRVRTANPLKANSQERRDTSQSAEVCAEADFREDLRHFLDPKPGSQRSE